MIKQIILLANNTILQIPSARQKEIDFWRVLYGFYVGRITPKKSQKILIETFKKIKTATNYNSDKDFWGNCSSLILSLEILAKNDFLESDLGRVLQDYNKWLIEGLTRQYGLFSEIDEPYYMLLAINRLKHGDIEAPNHRVMLVQLTEKIIEKIDPSKINLREVSVHHYIAVLAYLSTTNSYSEPKSNVLKNLAKQLEAAVRKERINLVLLHNLTAYPLICKMANLTAKVDWKPIISNWIKLEYNSFKEYTWEDRYYLLNTLIRMNNNMVDNIWGDEIKEILEKETKRIFEHTIDNNLQEQYLLALTVNSFLNPSLNSWDEILLVPQY